MNINTKATNTTLTPAITGHLNKRLSKLNKFLDPNDTSIIADVEIGMIKRGQNTGDIFRAEINLHIAGKSFRNVAEGSDLYNVIDEMQEGIIREVRQHKKRRIHLLRRGGQRIKEMVRGIKIFRKS
ncbi:ribosome-associated translation inhibitor RaiA [Patescibacteria group bacterium]|nr:ribosome-associated translation inhibitor RaiA [Patescibacteria group bacterium]MBU4057775.1 ribosome-associated translation inhibitor RaiA [Patescibacteria group bacterium]MBU4115825.1 ribosome-associated translation inhibitor RaiA [Patescibacteria group bacterium]